MERVRYHWRCSALRWLDQQSRCLNGQIKLVNIASILRSELRTVLPVSMLLCQVHDEVVEFYQFCSWSLKRDMTYKSFDECAHFINRKPERVGGKIPDGMVYVYIGPHDCKGK